MKHISPGAITGEPHAKAPTRRALAKQETRLKVLAAARQLFSEQGYEGATIRDIAAAAGMSTGAVFANFTDKSDLFREIIFADMEGLLVAMREGAQRGKTVEDQFLRLFVAGYAFYKTQLPLARAAFGVSWTVNDGQVLRESSQVADQMELFVSLLQQGVERGELSQEAEVKLRAQMLFDTYLSNYVQAIFGGWSLDALQARARDQIRILLAGARRG
jgi:AcrR family transcriptional regulator